MKKLAALLVVLSLGVFAIGCEKKDAGAPTGDTPPATDPAGGDTGGGEATP